MPLYSLSRNRVADMLLLVSEEFAYVIYRCHGRDASRTYGVRCSIQIPAMSEFRRICHLRFLHVEGDEPSTTPNNIGCLGSVCEADSEKGQRGQQSLCENALRDGYVIPFNFGKYVRYPTFGQNLFVAPKYKKASRYREAFLYQWLGQRVSRR